MFLDCVNVFGKLLPFIKMIVYLVKLVCYIIPIGLIILVIFDISKIVVASDDKKNQDGVRRIGKRVIYAIIIFLVPVLIKLVFSFIDVGKDEYGGDPDTALSCFSELIKEV